MVREAWPSFALTAVEEAGPDAKVMATDKHADWLLWHLPQLHGRVAFDIRFEILTKETFQRLLHWNSQVGDNWRSTADGYDVVVLDEEGAGSPSEVLLAEPGWILRYRDAKIAVLTRSEG